MLCILEDTICYYIMLTPSEGKKLSEDIGIIRNIIKIYIKNGRDFIERK